MALQAQLALEREHSQRLEDQLRNLADNDPLTDLLNRRSVEHEIEVHLARCARYGPEGALLLVGLDGLDTIAADLGRWEAGEVLAALGDMLGKSLRATDVAGRWERDQLVVLLPKATVTETTLVAEKLVRIVGLTTTPRVPAGSLVAAIGARIIGPSRGVPQLVAEASQAMATARSRGGGWVAAKH